MGENVKESKSPASCDFLIYLLVVHVLPAGSKCNVSNFRIRSLGS